MKWRWERVSWQMLDYCVKVFLTDKNNLQNTTMPDLLELLPDHQPRFLLLTYELRNKEESRVSYPLVFIFISPRSVIILINYNICVVIRHWHKDIIY